MILDALFGEGRSFVSESAVDPEIAGITLDSVEECAGDPFEFATAVMYENEMAMNNLNMAVMCCEYAYLRENGTEMVYEAGVMKNFFESAKAKVKEWWGKIVAFFKKIFNYVANFVRTDAKFAEANKEAAKKAGIVTGLDFKGYKYDVEVPSRMMNIIINLMAGFKDAFKDSTLDNTEDPGKVSENTFKQSLNTLRGDICKVGNKSAAAKIEAEDFASELNIALKGSEDKVEINVFDCPKAIAEIKSAQKTKEALQKLFDSAKKNADVVLKSLTKLESEANAKVAELTKKEDAEEKKKYGRITKSTHLSVNQISQMLSIATMVNNQGAKAITANNRQNRAFVAKAIAKYNKSVK